jgi:hypothetical protein|uniref:Uncharacterized protein n=1 Tax=viral metagenome TaxID=1070528 RepID=A0A6C0E543_9ZZZZ
MNGDFLKTVGLMIVIAIVIYFAFRVMNELIPRLQETFTENIEGLTTLSNSKNNLGSSFNGVAGNAATYSKKIEGQTAKMIDGMLIPKYRSDYESVLLNLEHFHNANLLNKLLNYNLNDPTKSSEELSDIVKHHDNVVQSLNNAMKFLDSQ